MNRFSFLLLVLILFSCNKEERFLNNALDIIEANSIMKDSIDWVAFRSKNIKKLKKGHSIKDVHKIISDALFDLGDNHSFLLYPEVEKKLYNDKNPVPFVKSELILDKIGYIKIPHFLGNDKQIIAFAKEIQNKIQNLDKNNLDLWIVDLRGNTGGNMFPMYLGLSPILKEGISGYFKMPNNKLKPWSYKNNAVFVGNKKMIEVESSYNIKSSSSKVAVLIDSQTGSSGEAIAILFKGFSNSKFFGFPTYGLTTGNDVFELSDSTKLVLTTCTFVDRNKKVYGKEIEPDIYSYSPKTEASDWLLSK